MPTTTTTKLTAIESRIAAGQPHVIITGIDTMNLKAYPAGTVEEYRASCLRVLAKADDLEWDDACAVARILLAEDGVKAAKMLGRIMREYRNVVVKRVEG